ncbi:hypothetical protein EVAR_88844_1 [Eumeta japonica]|uniref:Uncharacterized protein n=1 Tax=Eumeta variegata TaxID=151549 RepID=A0A4C1Y591_EUMVA|nr:hypothetical protein EVAR_88844_1 [Eumeta japonica]
MEEETYPAQRFDIVQSVLGFQRRFAREKRHKTASCNRSTQRVTQRTRTPEARIQALSRVECAESFVSSLAFVKRNVIYI